MAERRIVIPTTNIARVKSKLGESVDASSASVLAGAAVAGLVLMTTGNRPDGTSHAVEAQVPQRSPFSRRQSA
jgi:hypothetical protein